MNVISSNRSQVVLGYGIFTKMVPGQYWMHVSVVFKSVFDILIHTPQFCLQACTDWPHISVLNSNILQTARNWVSCIKTHLLLYQFILVLWIPHRYLSRNRGSHDWSTLWSQSTSKTFEHILQKINQIFQNWNYNLVSAMDVYYFHIILSITLTVTMRINSTTSWSCWREIPTFLVGRKRCQWRICDREA